MTGPAGAILIRTLRNTDAAALLAFETANRAWFEQHIAPREQAFYSPEGVAAHIAAYLAGHAEGTWHPFVLVDGNGRIVGRANLKDIDTAAGTAEVGYQIARDACGKGLATRALGHLIEQARTRWRLTRLLAHVYDDNVGSRKVLQRCGFLHERAAQADGRIDGHFVLTLPP